MAGIWFSGVAMQFCETFFTKKSADFGRDLKIWPIFRENQCFEKFHCILESFHIDQYFPGHWFYRRNFAIFS
jgi:hypothetical protein